VTTDTLTVEAPFFGFPNTGHGGYTGGLLAEHLAGTVQVKFVNPPPLEVPLSLARGEDTLTTSDGASVIAEARKVDLDIEIPEAPTFEVAEASAAANRDLRARPSATCMTCGPERAPGEGLRLFVGPVDGREIVAGAWIPHANFADADGILRTRFIWAALDCPTYWAVLSANGDQGRLVTARLAVRTIGPVPASEPVIVLAWPIAQRGRRLSVAGAAIVTPGGEALAVAEATWINQKGSPS
jgi:hypothetical protein